MVILNYFIYEMRLMVKTKVPQCGGCGGGRGLHIACHNVESKMKNYQLRCALAKVTSLDGTATQA